MLSSWIQDFAKNKKKKVGREYVRYSAGFAEELVASDDFCHLRWVNMSAGGVCALERTKSEEFLYHYKWLAALWGPSERCGIKNKRRTFVFLNGGAPIKIKYYGVGGQRGQVSCPFGSVHELLMLLVNYTLSQNNFVNYIFWHVNVNKWALIGAPCKPGTIAKLLEAGQNQIWWELRVHLKENLDIFSEKIT